MSEIINFVKDILMLETIDSNPIGLCGFESELKPKVKRNKPKKNKEMRLSELMNK